MYIDKHYPGLIIIPPTEEELEEGITFNEYIIEGGLAADENVVIMLDGSLLIKGNVKIDGNLKILDNLKVEGNIVAHGIESLGWELTATGDIETTTADIKVGSLIAEGNVRSEENIVAGGFIKVSGYISARLHIYAGNGISAGKYIKYGIALQAGLTGIRLGGPIVETPSIYFDPTLKRNNQGNIIGAKLCGYEDKRMPLYSNKEMAIQFMEDMSMYVAKWGELTTYPQYMHQFRFPLPDMINTSPKDVMMLCVNYQKGIGNQYGCEVVAQLMHTNLIYRVWNGNIDMPERPDDEPPKLWEIGFLSAAIYHCEEFQMNLHSLIEELEGTSK